MAVALPKVNADDQMAKIFVEAPPLGRRTVKPRDGATPNDFMRECEICPGVLPATDRTGAAHRTHSRFASPR